MPSPSWREVSGRPISICARTAASVRFLTPSTRNSAAMWIFVVASAILSSRAISLLESPRATRGSTSRWRGVSLAYSTSGAWSALRTGGSFQA